jgi:hypothetical protein
VSAATDETTALGWACLDCVMLANGETPPEMDEDQTAEWLAGIDANVGDALVTLGAMFEAAYGCEHSSPDDYEDHAESCERETFSWRRCDVCGSTLGGAREAVTFWLTS